MSKMDYSIKYCYTNHHAKMMMKYPPSKRFFLLYQSKANLMDLIRILITFVDRKCNQGQLLLPSKQKNICTLSDESDTLSKIQKLLNVSKSQRVFFIVSIIKPLWCFHFYPTSSNWKKLLPANLYYVDENVAYIFFVFLKLDLKNYM